MSQNNDPTLDNKYPDPEHPGDQDTIPLGAAEKSMPGETIGDTIGRFTLVRPIGEGGMGTVWLAEQFEPVKRQVALKVVKLGMDTREVVIRFEAERQALALMDHPSIARVLDGGATATGRPYFVMDLVHGSAITSYADEANLDLRERLELFMRVCDAVQHAHQKGIIHRDLKPSNVLVAKVDGVGIPKVIDFGIAKATSAELTQKTLFTHQSQMIGTPLYMAPEQADMTGHDIDTRADVYSLGVLLYELLTGTRPYDMDRNRDGGYLELLRTIREVDPEKPSTRVATTRISKDHSTGTENEIQTEALSRQLRGDLDWIVLKALEKDRNQRYATVNGLAADIGRFLASEPVLAHPQSAGYRLRKFVARRKRSVALAAALILALMVGAAGTTIGWYRTQNAYDKLDAALVQKEAERTAAIEARNLALELADFQHSAIVNQLDPADMGKQILVEFDNRIAAQLRRAGVDDTEVEATLSRFHDLTRDIPLADLSVNVIANSILEKSAQAIPRQYANRPDVAAELHRSLAMAYTNIGLYDESVLQLQQALKLTADHSALPGRRLKYRDELATELFLTGDFEAAFDVAVPLLEDVRTELGPGDPLTFKVASLLSLMMGKLGQREEAIALGEEVLSDWHQNPHPDGHVPYPIMIYQARHLTASDRHDEAEALLLEALELEEQGFWKQQDESASIELAFIRERQGRLDEAAKLYERGIEVYRQQYGSDRMATVVVMNNLAFVYLKQGRNDEAEALLLEVVESARANMGPTNPNTGVFIHTLGETYQASGQLDKAEAALLEAREIYEMRKFTKHLGSLLVQLAQIAAATDRPEESLALLEGAAEFGLPQSMLGDPVFDGMRQDPRFVALTRG